MLLQAAHPLDKNTHWLYRNEKSQLFFIKTIFLKVAFVRLRQIFSIFLKYDYSAILSWHWNAPRWRQRHGGRRGGLSEAQLWQNFQVSGDSQTTLQRISHSGSWPVLPLSHLWDGLQAQEETGRASEPCPRDQRLSGQCPHAQLISVEPVLV